MRRLCTRTQEGAGNTGSRRGSGGVPQSRCIGIVPPAEGEGARGKGPKGLWEDFLCKAA